MTTAVKIQNVNGPANIVVDVIQGLDVRSFLVKPGDTSSEIYLHDGCSVRVHEAHPDDVRFKTDEPAG